MIHIPMAYAMGYLLSPLPGLRQVPLGYRLVRSTVLPNLRSMEVSELTLFLARFKKLSVLEKLFAQLFVGDFLNGLIAIDGKHRRGRCGLA